MTYDQALAAHTTIPAYQMAMEEKVGSLEVGKFADMAIFANNLREIAENEPQNLIEKGTVVGTVLGGKFVTPGFIDTHFHSVAAAIITAEVDTGDIPDNEGMYDRLREFAAANPVASAPLSPAGPREERRRRATDRLPSCLRWPEWPGRPPARCRLPIRQQPRFASPAATGSCPRCLRSPQPS